MSIHDSENCSGNSPDKDSNNAFKRTSGDANFDEPNLDSATPTPVDAAPGLAGEILAVADTVLALAGNHPESVILEQSRRDEAGTDALEPTPARDLEPMHIDDLEPVLTDDGGEDDQTVPSWLAHLHPMIPDKLFAPFDPTRRRFCFRKFGPTEHCGLIVFSKKEAAAAYMEACLVKHGFAEIRSVTLNQVYDVAQTYHWRVDCVALVDDLLQPVFQLVR